MYETHGMSGTNVYTAWKNIKQRCNGTTGGRADVNYHERGIRYDPKWETFAGFYEDMGESYVEGFDIDRIDNSTGYTKANCRWTTRKINANNKRSNVFVEFKGTRKTIAEWCDFLGVNRAMVYKRWSYYNIRDPRILFSPKTTPGVRVGATKRAKRIKDDETGRRRYIASPPVRSLS